MFESVETLEAEDGWCRFEVRLPTTIDQVEGSNRLSHGGQLELTQLQQTVAA